MLAEVSFSHRLSSPLSEPTLFVLELSFFMEISDDLCNFKIPQKRQKRVERLAFVLTLLISSLHCIGVIANARASKLVLG